MTDTETHEIQARALLNQQKFGVLSTISLVSPGYPFGSVTPYALDQAGNLIIYISFLAEHYKNLQADPRASLIVLDWAQISNPQASARLTVLTQFKQVPKEESATVKSIYEDRFPGSIKPEIAANFEFMRGIPEKMRWIAGFGSMSWIEP